MNLCKVRLTFVDLKNCEILKSIMSYLLTDVEVSIQVVDGTQTAAEQK
jgi:hypothetical protein